MTYGDRLREARRAKGLTQGELAVMVGVAKSTLTGYEKGNREPSIATTYKLIDALGIDANYLFQDGMALSADSPFQLRLSEVAHLKKYRTLDDYSRLHIDAMLDWEALRVCRTSAQEAQASRVLAYFRNLTSAREGAYLFEDIPTDTIRVPADDVSGQADFVIRVTDSSLEPLYHDGDEVYVQKTAALSAGDIGVYTPGDGDRRVIGRVLGRVPERVRREPEGNLL